MKKLLIIISLVAFSCTAAKNIIVGKSIFGKKSSHEFTVNGINVYMDGQAIAKYQAKTYSLDGGELVEEYNLLLLNNKLTDKQIIGDLIDFVSDRHEGAEVEVEIDSDKSIFGL
jgi:hypothetical protein